MPTLTDVLMAPGAFSVPFRRDPELDDLLTYFRHIQFWWDSELVAQGPLLTKDPQTGLLVASGALMPWWLGVDNEGLIVDLLRYCAANNKLSNGDFSLDDLYWNRGEDSGWVIAGGVATAGDFEGEDQLNHQDSFEVFAGDPMIYGATAHVASGNPGYLRVRTVLSGRFVHPELIVNGGFESGAAGWTTDSDTSILTDANARSGTKVLKLGPVTKPNLIVDATEPTNWETGDLPAGTHLDFDGDRFGGTTIREQFLLNRSFESGTLDDWDDGSTGNVSVQSDGGAMGTDKYVRFADGGTDTAAIWQELPGPQSGDEMHLSFFARCPEGALSSGGKDIPLIVQLRYTEEDEDFDPTLIIDEILTVQVQDSLVSTFKKRSARVNVPDHEDGTLELRAVLPRVIAAASGYWDLDHFKLQRTRGNVEAIAQVDYFDVEPERAYEGSVVVETENVRRHGQFSLQVITTNGSDIETITAAELTVSEKGDTNTLHTLDFSFTPQEGHDQAKVKLLWQDVYVGAIWAHLDTLDIHAESGHRRRVYQTGKSVTSGRSYAFKGYIRPDDSLTKGRAWLRAILKQDPAIDPYYFRDDIIVEGPSIEFRDDALWAEVSLNVTPETGYDVADIEIVCEDAEGGSFWVDDLTMADGDKNSLVIESKLLPTAVSSTSVSGSFTVPQGAENAGFQIAVDGADGSGWVVDDAYFRRDCTPVAATTVVSDAISGTGLSNGTLHDAGTIGFDLVFRSQTRRQILDEVSSAGVVQPPREWRVNPDGSVDWGTPEELYVDRTDILLSEGDSWLIQDPDAQRSMERFFTRHKVLGQERRSINGDSYTVTGEASNDPGNLELFDGSEFSRDQLIEDGGVDHAGFAEALAQDAADVGAEEQESYVLGLADWRTLGKFNVGDWVYLYHPTEGIEDPDNPVSVEGRTIYPKKLRVLERELTCGSGPFRCVLRRGPEDDPDGGIDLSEFVEWPAMTTATVTVGSPRAEFLLNPLGGSAGSQFLKYRRAVPSA